MRKRKGQEKSFIAAAVFFIILLAVILLVFFKFWPMIISKAKELGLV